MANLIKYKHNYNMNIKYIEEYIKYIILHIMYLTIFYMNKKRS